MKIKRVRIIDLLTYQPNPDPALNKEQNFLLESGLDYLQETIGELEGDSQQYQKWLDSFTDFAVN